MTIDPTDTHNLHRFVHEGNLSRLRSYAKAVMRLDDARRGAKHSGRPVTASLPDFNVPRGKISMYSLTEGPVADPSETVFLVTTDAAITKLQAIVERIIGVDPTNGTELADAVVEITRIKE